MVRTPLSKSSIFGGTGIHGKHPSTTEVHAATVEAEIEKIQELGIVYTLELPPTQDASHHRIMFFL